MGAGNSSKCRSISVAGPVYPRGCGELKVAKIPNFNAIGLSPWVRGTRDGRNGSAVVYRFIPVGAGNSLGYMGVSIELPVYPRGCGELSLWGAAMVALNGLSPWVRGTRVESKYCMFLSRFIPVGAGNSIHQT